MRINNVSPSFGMSAKGVQDLNYQLTKGTPLSSLLRKANNGLYDVTAEEIIRPPLIDSIAKRASRELFSGARDSWNLLIEHFTDKK